MEASGVWLAQGHWAPEAAEHEQKTAAVPLFLLHDEVTLSNWNSSQNTVSGPTSLQAERTQAGNPSSSWAQHINGRGCKQVVSELNLVVCIQSKEWYYFLATCMLKPTGDLATWGLHSCGHHQWHRSLCPSTQAGPLQLTPGPPAYVTHLFTCWALWALEFDPLLCMWWSCSQDHQARRWGQNGGAQG